MDFFFFSLSNCSKIDVWATSAMHNLPALALNKKQNKKEKEKELKGSTDCKEKKQLWNKPVTFPPSPAL